MHVQWYRLCAAVSDTGLMYTDRIPLASFVMPLLAVGQVVGRVARTYITMHTARSARENQSLPGDPSPTGRPIGLDSADNNGGTSACSRYDQCSVDAKCGAHQQVERGSQRGGTLVILDAIFYL